MERGYQDRRSGGSWVLLAAVITGGSIAGALLYLVDQRQHPEEQLEVSQEHSADASNDSTGRTVSAHDAATPISTGAPANGALKDAVPLPQLGTGYEVLSVHQGRDLFWGTREIVALVTYVGERLHQKHGRTMLVGNLSAREGGPIRHSASHQSGRDVDLAFCYRKPNGNPANPPGYVPLDRHGRARHLGLEIDPAATWTQIESALAFEQAPVQHIFISRGLQKILLDYAQKSKVDPGIYARAKSIMAQPRGAEPHNDHIHIRISCPPSSGDQCTDRTRFKGGNQFHEAPPD